MSLIWIGGLPERWALSRSGAVLTRKGADPGVYLQISHEALADVYAKLPGNIGSGGTIPVVGEVESILGISTLLMGFGLEDDRMHSPTEKFERTCFDKA